MKRITALLSFCIICFLFFATSVHAEVIYLKDGSVIKGTIASSSEEAITVKTSTGEMVIKKADIKQVEYGEPKEVEKKEKPPSALPAPPSSTPKSERTSLVVAESAELKNNIGIGIGWPYISCKYRFTPNLFIEPKFSFGQGILAFGGRFCYNFNPTIDRLFIYTGGEYDFTTFDVTYSDGKRVYGSGNLFEGFIGVEYFVTSFISLNSDIGPAYTNLTENEYTLTADGWDWIINLCVNYYFK